MSVVGETTVRVGADTSGFQKQASSGITGSLAKIGAAVGGGVLAFKAFDFLKDSVIGFNSELQQSRVAFTTLLGGVKPANQALAQLQSFAKTTPYDFENLLPVAQQLLGTGTKLGDLVPIMTNLGNAVSATGGSADQLKLLTLAYTQMSTSGVAHLGDLMQMNNAVPGILSKMAKAGGMSIGEFRDKVSKGMISSADAVKLFKGATKDFGGAMDAQSHTFVGAMSNIHDALQQTLAKVGAPLFAMVADGANRFAGELSKLSGVFDTVLKHTGSTATALGAVFQVVLIDLGVSAGTAQSAVTGISIAWSILTGAISVSIGVLKTVIGYFNGNRDAMTALIAVIAAVLAGYMAWKVVSGVIRAVAAAQLFLNTVMEANPIGLVVVAVVGLIAILAILYTRNQQVRNVVNQVWGFLRTFVPAAISAIRGAISTAIQAVTHFWNTNQTMRGIVMGVWGAIRSYVGGQIAIMKDVALAIMALFQGRWGEAWHQISKVPGDLLRSAIGVVRGLGGAFVSAAAGIGGKIVDGIVNGVDGLYQRIKDKLESELHDAMTSLNPFSPVEHGAEIYIGRPIVEGALAGVADLGKQMRTMIDASLATHLPRVRAITTDLQPSVHPVSALARAIAPAMALAVPSGQPAAAVAGGPQVNFHAPVTIQANDPADFMSQMDGLAKRSAR